MKALSLHPEWALEVLLGEKSVECRSWETSHRGDLLICSTKKRTPGTIPGRALCVVELLDVVPFADEHMEAALFDEMPPAGSFAWILGQPREIYPFKVNGKQRLYEIEDGLIEYLPDGMTDDEANDVYYPIFYPPVTPESLAEYEEYERQSE